MTTYKSNRRYPNPITVTDDPHTHTLALQQIIEALNIGQRRTKDILNSFVRLHELVDAGLIEITNGQLSLTLAPNTHNALDGLTVGDPHTQYGLRTDDEEISGQWRFTGGSAGNNWSIALSGTVASPIAKDYAFQRDDVNRWLLRMQATAESGGNVGSDFELLARDDSGAALWTVLKVIRSTGIGTWAKDVVFSSNIELGHATDTTLARGAAGEVDIEGDRVWNQGNVGTQISALTADTVPDGAADYVAAYDASAGAAKKVLMNKLPGGDSESMSFFLSR